MSINIIHCSYHKCLTIYYQQVLSKLYNKILRHISTKRYKHFYSFIEEFYNDFDKYKVCSINNQALDLSVLGNNYRITRFIRDPRDLIVSGYFYHKKGAESWCNVINPKEVDWKIVNGYIPKNMPEGYSFSSYLRNLSKEEGLKAEIEFRKYHLRSMKEWPMFDPNIKLIYYEDILGNEKETFLDIFRHYGLTLPEKWIGYLLASKYSFKSHINKTKHIRNPHSGQWKEHFTSNVTNYFKNQYGDILERYGYNNSI